MTTARRWASSGNGDPSVEREKRPRHPEVNQQRTTDSNRTIKYLPRRSTSATRSPSSSRATSTGSSGRVSRGSAIRTCSKTPALEHAARAAGERSRPRAARASPHRSCGVLVDDLEQHVPLARRRRRSSSYAASTSRCGLVGLLPRRARGPRRAPRPPRPRRPRLAWQTMPTAWSTASSFVRRPAPRWTAALPIRIAPARRTYPPAGAVDLADDRRTRRAQTRRRCRPAPRSSGARSPRPLPSATACLGAAAALGLVDAEIREREQPRAGVEHELGEVGRPSPRTVSSASSTSSALPTAAPSGWSMSVSRQTTSRPACSPSEIIASASCARVLDRLHEGAVADLDVEHDRLRAGGELLRHDRRRDQRELVDGRGDVAQAVEQLVGRNEVAGLADDRDARRRAPAR